VHFGLRRRTHANQLQHTHAPPLPHRCVLLRLQLLAEEEEEEEKDPQGGCLEAGFLQAAAKTISIFEHIELPAKLLDYFLRSNKSYINQFQVSWVCLV